MKISNLRTNGMMSPLGYTFPYLTLSWQTEQVLQQTNSKLLMTITIATDQSFKHVILQRQTSNIDNQVSLKPNFLQARTRYYWQVEAQGQVAASYFETGKMTESWEASWLTYAGESQDSVAFTKQFVLPKPIRQARIYLVGYGLYELYVNDQQISHEKLLPGYQSYDLTNYYQTFDITAALKAKNSLRVITGNGWYKGRFVFDGGQSNIYGDRQKLIAELHVDYQDGTTQLVKTAPDWKVTTTVIQDNSIYDGETVDYTIPLKQLSTVVLPESTAKLEARHDAPVVGSRIFHPKSVFRDNAGQWIVDFGQELTGWVNFDLPADSSKVRLRFGELLQDGEFFTGNLRTAKQTLTVINNGKRHHIRPHFTYFGFRYVEVQGLTKPQLGQLIAELVQTEIPETFKFDSANPKLNRLVKNIQWSQRDNSLSIPTDCPQRDERMGWTGDVTVFSNTAAYNGDMRAFYANYLHNLELEQQLLSGSIPFFVPYPKIKPFKGINPFLISNGAATWGDVATVLPMNLWQHYHDKGLLAMALPIMKGWVDYVHQRDVAHGNHHLWDFDSQLGDWLALDNQAHPGPIGATDSALIASVYYYRSVSYYSQALQILAFSADKYVTLATQIRAAILDHYYDGSDVTLTPLTQTGLALMLRYKLYPDEIARKRLVNQLRTLLANNHNRLNTGFIGTPELLHALADNGCASIAYQLLLREDQPSWLFEVDHGATTVWERWNSLLPNGQVSGTEMNSLNHYAYGSVEDFIVEKMLGIDIKAGAGSYLISPCYTSSVEWVTGELVTPNGPLKFGYHYSNQHDWSIQMTVPNRCTVRLTLPDGVQKQYSGGIYERWS